MHHARLLEKKLSNLQAMLPPDPQRRRPDGRVAPHYRWLKTIGIANPLHGSGAAGVDRLERDFGDGTSYICRGCGWCECTSLALLQAPSIVWTFTDRTRDDHAYDNVRHLCRLNDTSCTFDHIVNFQT
ncbi:hypothetical protein [Sinorhizobium meliloti]|uniref:hypothetical protein n=1 Tax=Rhizobium meliloti TaxID=382 RepID=UPI0013E2E968|nr:hypothetical protein [Sinorhizobium meliloti]MCM5690923.1 hypothetical protein [Sinorhizobium meliloti]